MGVSNFKIAPSILSADFSRLGEEVAAVLDAGADWIHFDVMDHHFVPNLTIGPMVCQSLRDYGIKAPLDVHLMVDKVDPLIDAFAKAGASHISIHVEACSQLDDSLQHIRDLGCQVGLAFNPDTKLDVLESILERLDYILLMSVQPGFGGQVFITETLSKIEQARLLIDQSNLPIRLQVDGGITQNIITQVATAGADVFVAGSAIFNRKKENYKDAIDALRRHCLPVGL